MLFRGERGERVRELVERWAVRNGMDETPGAGSSSPAAWRSTPCTHLTPLGNLTYVLP